MRVVTKILLGVVAGSLIAAIWANEYWWQCLVTGVVFLFAAVVSDMEHKP